ncbi:polysaccharide deacetylase family protein [Pelomonas sp. Root1237]|uniref:polysaccharide deacetylase family protein n=1 Tax=Pelomonas sp. Root1237 TaxID=1736434 RepID=UPI0006F4D27E|nr:polysaccharide deacetylase family protein [Pelomonas sp. Root1237]KQV92398.1 polysaccharide deacetylase [Pelomonas sp. Root1237]
MRALLLAAAGLLMSWTVQAAPFVWPNGAQAAVSLGYDDALDSQLDHVVPALNKRGLRASFYIPINGPTLPGRQNEWKAAAAAGHELGNHSLFHGCSAKGPGREWVQPQRDLERQMPAQVQEQVIAANTWLQALDGKARRTFTPPCLDMQAGGQDFVAALKPHFVAYRAAGPAMATDAAALDPYAMPVYFVEGWSGEQLIALVEKAAAQHALVSLLFHGVGAEHLSVTRQAHDQLLDHLAKNKARFWTDSFVNVMENARKQAGR